MVLESHAASDPVQFNPVCQIRATSAEICNLPSHIDPSGSLILSLSAT